MGRFRTQAQLRAMNEADAAGFEVERAARAGQVVERWRGLEDQLGEWAADAVGEATGADVEAVKAFGEWVLGQVLRLGPGKVRRVWVKPKVLAVLVRWMRGKMKEAGEVDLRKLRYAEKGGVMFLGVAVEGDDDGEYGA